MINAAKLRVNFEGDIGEILVLFLWHVRFLKLHMDGVDTHLDVSDALHINSIRIEKEGKNEDKTQP